MLVYGRSLGHSEYKNSISYLIELYVDAAAPVPIYYGHYSIMIVEISIEYININIEYILIYRS